MKSLMVLVVMFLALVDAGAKEVFTLKHIKNYLTKENPYIYKALAKQYVDEAKVAISYGAFDTKLSAEYDKKEYPVSTGEFGDITVSKPLQNGVEILAGYRKAIGTQEYNNIKTGYDGEFRVGLKVPLNAVTQGINQRKFTLDSARLNATKSRFDSKNNLRNIYAHIALTYHKLLYYNQLYTLEQKLLQKALKRDDFIQKRVSSGDMPQLALLESKQLIIARKQRVQATKSYRYEALQSLLKYLNLSQEKFESLYQLPTMQQLKKSAILFQNALSQALSSRADLKALEVQKMQLELDKEYNELSKYPKVDLFAYGVSDLEYGEGVKVGLSVDIPLERRSYKGKNLQLARQKEQLSKELEILKLELKTNLKNLLFALETITHNIQLSKQEIALAKELESAENKKYEVGSSNLFELNIREMATLRAQQKLLEYYLNALATQQEIYKEMGDFVAP